MKKLKTLMLALCAAATGCLCAATSEISVSLKLTAHDYVIGERVRGVIDIKNISPDSISVGYPDSRDYLLIEVYKAADMEELEKTSKRAFSAPFRLDPNEGQKLEVHIADHFGVSIPRRYLARPVLVHRSTRYEGQYVAFDIVPGMETTSALQTFSNRDGLMRDFKLVHWTRNGDEHIFLTAQDQGTSERSWETRDLGPMMRITKPFISILPSGKVIVFHRLGPDNFLRSEFWSMPDALEFVSRELVQDPETAGQTRVKELYDSAGGVKPVDRPWWKFW